jgi:cullin-associated NEDD8-dissociated protein 1
VQCLSIIAKSIGSKLSPHLSQIIPVLRRLTTGLKRDESVDEDNELTETALTTLEAIIRKCPLEVNSYLDDLLDTSFTLISYDPNYVYNDEEDEEMKEDDEDNGGWGDDYSDEGGVPEDDDDTSWKVRRASVAIIDAVIKTRHDKVKQIIHNYSSNLVDRVKERIDDVKIEILNTL